MGTTIFDLMVITDHCTRWGYKLGRIKEKAIGGDHINERTGEREHEMEGDSC